jgi:hypothetical protein
VCGPLVNLSVEDRRESGHDKFREKSKIRRKIKIGKRMKSTITIKSGMSMHASQECWSIMKNRKLPVNSV